MAIHFVVKFHVYQVNEPKIMAIIEVAINGHCFVRVNFDGMISAYNCCTYSMRPAHITSAKRMVLSKSDTQHLHDSCTKQEKN